jgi:hypothetical protein
MMIMMLMNYKIIIRRHYYNAIIIFINLIINLIINFIINLIINFMYFIIFFTHILFY